VLRGVARALHLVVLAQDVASRARELLVMAALHGEARRFLDLAAQVEDGETGDRAEPQHEAPGQVVRDAADQ